MPSHLGMRPCRPEFSTRFRSAARFRQRPETLQPSQCAKHGERVSQWDDAAGSTMPAPPAEGVALPSRIRRHSAARHQPGARVPAIRPPGTADPLAKPRRARRSNLSPQSRRFSAMYAKARSVDSPSRAASGRRPSFNDELDSIVPPGGRDGRAAIPSAWSTRSVGWMDSRRSTMSWSWRHEPAEPIEPALPRPRPDDKMISSHAGYRGAPAHPRHSHRRNAAGEKRRPGIARPADRPVHGRGS